MILSILLFFAITFFLGFIIDLIVKDWKSSFFEKIVIRIGSGALMIPVFGVLFNHLRVPIHWISFLVLAVIIFILAFNKRKSILTSDFESFKKDLFSLRIKKSTVYTIFVIIIFAISAYMYISGTFNYPWFENGDPYSYALASKYISIQHKYDAPYYFTHFAEPYPQGYTIMMGVLHQTNDSIYWTMKFFTSLLVSLSVLFFFYFAKRFTKSASIAFWAIFVLAAIPAWLSHFVFSLNFNMALMFIPFYAIFSVKENKNWKYLAAIFYGSLLMSHFYTAVIITGLLAILYFLRVLTYKEFSKDYLDIILLGAGLSLLFWAPAVIKHWEVLEAGEQVGGLNVFFPILQKISSSFAFAALFAVFAGILVLAYLKRDAWFVKIKHILSMKNASFWIYLAIVSAVLLLLIVPSGKLIYIKGSGTRTYGFADFFIASKGNLINNPLGIGLALMIIFVVGLALILLNFKKLFKEENFYLLVSFTWALFSFIGLMGAKLSIGFVPFRMWTFFGMSLALIAGYAIYSIISSLGKMSNQESYSILIRLGFIILLVFSAYYTSFSQKYWHNTAQWPEHQVMIPESQQLYVWMKDGGLPKNTKVLPLCNRPSLVLGYDMLTEPWVSEEFEEDGENVYYRLSLNQSLDENYNFLKKYGYDYVIFGASCVVKFKADQEMLNTRIKEMINSTKFSIVKNTNTEFLFKVN